MADGSARTRVVMMVPIGVAAFAAGAVTLSLVTSTSAPSGAQGGAPGGSATDAEKQWLRAELKKIADSKADLQRRLAEAEHALDVTRAELAAIKSAAAPDKPKAIPTDTPGTAGSDTHACVVQAVDNKNDIYVISIGSKDGVETGMEFEVRRKSNAVGSIVIDKVFPNYASAMRKPGSAAFVVEPGDDCETVPSKVRLPK